MSFRGIDLFSSSFSFNIGGSKLQKGTRAGSIFTIIVIILTLSYFVYLFKLYFSNQIEPTYRAQSIINNQTQSIDIQQNIYGIKLNYAESISQTLKYGIIQISGTFTNDTNTQRVNINTQSCQDPHLNQFQCLSDINYGNNQTETEIKNKNYNYKLTEIDIFVFSCNENILNLKNCASQQEIDKALNGGEIVLKMQLSYFDIYKKKVIQSYQTFSILISTDQIKTSTIKLQNQKATVKDGLFIQDESIFVMPTNYNIDNQNVNKQNLGFNIFSFINLKVDQIYQEVSIQYQTVPYVVAQVSSVFNILIFVFFFMKYISQSSLQHDLFVILIKNVYQDVYQQILKLNGFENLNLQDNHQKCTQNNNSEKQAQTDKIENPGVSNFVELKNVQIRENEKQIQDQQDSKNVVQQKNENDQFTSFQDQQTFLNFNQQNKFGINKIHEQKILKNQSLGPKEEELNKLKSKEENFSYAYSKNSIDQNKVCQMSNSFNGQSQPKLEENKVKNPSSFQQNNQKKQDSFIKKFFGKNEYLKSIGIKKEHKKKIERQLKKDLDILQFYKDIIFLKKAIMMILSQDQLASLKYIGCSTSLLDQNQTLNDIENDKCNLNKYLFKNQLEIFIKIVSHYEKQTEILNSQDLQYQHTLSFLERCSDKDNMTEIDKRILRSISRIYFS